MVWISFGSYKEFFGKFTLTKRVYLFGIFWTPIVIINRIPFHPDNPTGKMYRGNKNGSSLAQ